MADQFQHAHTPPINIRKPLALDTTLPCINSCIRTTVSLDRHRQRKFSFSPFSATALAQSSPAGSPVSLAQGHNSALNKFKQQLLADNADTQYRTLLPHLQTVLNSLPAEVLYRLSGTYNNKTKWRQLDNDILSHIHTYLNVYDLCTAAQVNKQFYYVSQYHTSWHNKSIKLKHYDSDAVYTILQRLPYISHITLHNTMLSDCAVQQLYTLSKLQSLHMTTPHPLIEQNKAAFQQLTQLTALTCTLNGDSAVAMLQPLSNLTYLNINCITLTDIGLHSICTTLPKLSTLILSTCNAQITDGGIASLTQLTDLSRFECTRVTRLTGSAIAHLVQCTKLTHLCLKHCSANVIDGLPLISKLAALQHLNLEGLTVDDCAITAISQLKQLKYLSVDSRLLSDFGMSLLSSMHALTHLVTDASVPNDTYRLAKLTNLTHLTLRHCYLRDTNCAQLAALSQLRFVSLQDCYEITVTGVRHFASMPAMRKVMVKRCPYVGVRALKQLQKRIPHVKIKNVALKIAD